MIEAFKLLGEIALEGARGVQRDLERVEKKIKDTQEKFKNWGDSVRGAGEQLSAFVTLPLTALGAGAMVTASQFGDSQAMIQAQLGLTGKEAEKLNEVAKGVWSNGFGEDLGQAQQAVTALYRIMGDIPQAEMHALSEGVLTINKAFGADTQETMRAVNNLMKNFGMSAQEAMDYVTRGFQENLDFSGEFLESISEYSTYFSEMGMTGDDFFATLKSGAESGAFQLDKVGDAMKEFSLRAKDGSKATNEAFQGLGLNATEMGNAFNAGGEQAKQAFETVVTKLQGVESETERNAIAVSLFGTQYEDLGEQAFTAFLTANKGLDNVAGATDRAGKAFAESFGQRFQAFLRQAQTTLEPLGLVLLDIAEKALPPLVTGLTMVATWFSNLSGGSQMFVVIMGILGALIPPLLMAFGMMAQGMAFLVPIISKAWSIFGKLRLALLATNPIVFAVIAVIGLLVFAGIKLYQNWDKISAWLKKSWESIKKKASEVWSGIVTKFEEVKTKASTAMQNMKTNVTTAWNNLKTSATTTFNNIKDSIWRPIDEARGKVQGIVDKIRGFFTNLKLSIPKPSLPSLPKFSLATSTKEIMGKSITFPTGFNVKWNAQGAYVNGATLIGAGEAGGEGIVPLEGKHMFPIAQKIAEYMSAGATATTAGARIEIPLVLNGREIARAIVPNMDTELKRQQALRKRGV